MAGRGADCRAEEAATEGPSAAVRGGGHVDEDTTARGWEGSPESEDSVGYLDGE